MEIAIKKIGTYQGTEQFILVNAKSREVITLNAVSEDALRRFFLKLPIAEDTVTSCVSRARERYEDAVSQRHPPVDEAAETIADDDLLFQLGLRQHASAAK